MPEAANATASPLVIGRYALFEELASGGMATVHLGRVLGAMGRTVAIKRLHAHYLKDAEFVAMFMDEARIVSRIPSHPNVVPMVDLMRTDEGLFLVIEYVHGESLSRLLRDQRKLDKPIPLPIIGSIVSGVLHGLHAAHETKGRDGKLVHLVHRDVSPQNIMVGVDGIPRVLDFGIAKAVGRSQSTREGQIKGKLAYMAPEQIRGQVDRRTDIFAAAVVLWEMLAGRRIHGSTKDIDIVTRLMRGTIGPPSEFAPELSAEVDAVVLKGIAFDPNKRYATAHDLAVDVERTVGLASPTEVGDWARGLAHKVLAARAERVKRMVVAAEDLEGDDFVAVEETSRAVPLSSPRLPVTPAPAVTPAVAPTVPPPVTPAATAKAPPLPPRASRPETVETTPAVPPERGSIPELQLQARPAVVERRPPPVAETRRVVAGIVVTPVLLAAAACLVLAVIGGALGGYALHRRSSVVPAPAPTDSTASVVVEHPVLPVRTSLPAAPASLAVPTPAAVRPAAAVRPSATASADDSPPQSFSAGPSMIPTPLARPSPTP